jgi:hypothetical protein
MKSIRTVVLLLLAVLLPACGAVRMTPEQTVKRYFGRMGRKDQAGMDELVVAEHRDTDAELERLSFVELTRCKLETDQSVMPLQSHWYTGDVSDTALVRTTFYIEYENGGGAGFDNGEYNWYFWLVKDSEDASWKIVMNGA